MYPTVISINLIESYLFRRTICNLPTNSLNSVFPLLANSIDKDNYLESMQAYLQSRTGKSRFPDDNEFIKDIKERNIYEGLQRKDYYFHRLENYDRKEFIHTVDYSIEHIMPKNLDKWHEWKESLGEEEWKRVHEKYLHTLGNLTLTGYNSEYSNKPFADKQNMEGGFKDSPLWLNEGLGQVEEWNEAEINNRANRLAEKSLEIWKYPNLDPDTLKQHKKSTTKYSIENDHPQLLASPVRELFEAFREKILDLDKSVKEEILRRYIAYKADSNFANIIPRSDRLKIYLTIPFSKIRDSRDMCEDVKKVGHHGSGDVLVTLTSLDELDYIIDLVNQSLEYQILGEYEEDEE